MKEVRVSGKDICWALFYMYLPFFATHSTEDLEVCYKWPLQLIALAVCLRYFTSKSIGNLELISSLIDGLEPYLTRLVRKRKQVGFDNDDVVWEFSVRVGIVLKLVRAHLALRCIFYNSIGEESRLRILRSLHRMLVGINNKVRSSADHDFRKLVSSSLSKLFNEFLDKGRIKTDVILFDYVSKEAKDRETNLNIYRELRVLERFAKSEGEVVSRKSRGKAPKYDSRQRRTVKC